MATGTIPNLSYATLFNSTTPYYLTYSDLSSKLVQIPAPGSLGTISSSNTNVRYDTPCTLKAGKVYYIQVQLNIGKTGSTPSSEKLVCSIFPLDTVSGCILTTTIDAGLSSDGSGYELTLNGYISPTIDYNTLEVGVASIGLSGSSTYAVGIPLNTFIYINEIN